MAHKIRPDADPQYMVAGLSGFPRFVDEAGIATGRFVIAYPHKPLKPNQKVKPLLFPSRPSRRYQ